LLTYLVESDDVSLHVLSDVTDVVISFITYVYCNFVYTQKCHEKSVLQNFNVKKFVVACLYIQINGTTTARKNTASNTKGIMNQHVAGALVEAIVLIVAEP